MKLTRNFSYLTIITLILVFNTSCSQEECIGVSDSTDTKYYQDFDFFKLEGREEIESSTMCYPFVGIQKREDNISLYIHSDKDTDKTIAYFKKTRTERVLDKVLSNGDLTYYDKTIDYWESYEFTLITDDYKKAQMSYYLDSLNVIIDYTITNSTGKREVNSIAIVKPTKTEEYIFKEDKITFEGDTATSTLDKYKLWSNYKTYISGLSLEKNLKHKKERIFTRENNVLTCKEVIKEGTSDNIILEKTTEYDYDYSSLFWWSLIRDKFEM